MLVGEITSEMERRGWSVNELAWRLHLTPAELQRILCGKKKLSRQLAAHIQLLFQRTADPIIYHTVSLPATLCKQWIPGWQKMNEKQRHKALEAALQSAAEQLALEGEQYMNPDELEFLRTV